MRFHGILFIFIIIIQLIEPFSAQSLAETIQGNGKKFDFFLEPDGSTESITLTLDVLTTVCLAYEDQMAGGEIESTAIQWKNWAQANPLMYNFVVAQKIISKMAKTTLTTKVISNIDVTLFFVTPDEHGFAQAHKITQIACGLECKENFNIAIDKTTPWFLKSLKAEVGANSRKKN